MNNNSLNPNIFDFVMMFWEFWKIYEINISEEKPIRISKNLEIVFDNNVQYFL